ncbi:hypothetical protein ABN127_25030, partial [Escherichia coli]
HSYPVPETGLHSLLHELPHVPHHPGGLFDNFSNIRRSTTCQGCTQITASQSLYRCRCSLYRLLVFPCYTLAAPHPAL